MRFDTSMDSLNVTRSESVTDLNTEINGLPHPRRASTGHTRNDENFISAPPKSFGIGKNVSYLLCQHLININVRIIKIHRYRHTFYDFLISRTCTHFEYVD